MKNESSKNKSAHLDAVAVVGGKKEPNQAMENTLTFFNSVRKLRVSFIIIIILALSLWEYNRKL